MKEEEIIHHQEEELINNSSNTNNNTNPVDDTNNNPLKEETNNLMNGNQQQQLTGLEGLPHHLLSEMKTNIGQTVEELSRKHVVLLVFLRYFGCVFCQKSVVQIVNSLSSLIKLNCIPVFVHQESKEEADEFFSERKMPKPLIKLEKKENSQTNNVNDELVNTDTDGGGGAASGQYEVNNGEQVLTSQTTSKQFEKNARSKLMKQFLRVEDPEGTYYYKEFGVIPSATKMVTFTSTLEAFKLSLTEGYKLTPDASDKADRNQLAGSFIVANGRIVNQFITHSASKIPDFLELLLDVEGKGSDNLFDLLNLSNDNDSTNESNTDNDDNHDQEEEDEAAIVVESSSSSSQVTLVERRNVKDLIDKYPMARKLASLPKEVLKLKEKQSFSCTAAAQPGVEDAISLKESLSNPHYRKVFKLFAAKIFAIESLLFWEHATIYQKSLRLKKRKQLAHYIVDTYLNADSMLEINISSSMKKEVLEKYEKEGAVSDLFEEVKLSMEGDAIKDSYLRFIESRLYHEKIGKFKAN